MNKAVKYTIVSFIFSSALIAADRYYQERNIEQSKRETSILLLKQERVILQQELKGAKIGLAHAINAIDQLNIINDESKETIEHLASDLCKLNIDRQRLLSKSESNERIISNFNQKNTESQQRIKTLEQENIELRNYITFLLNPLEEPFALQKT